jgi:hypothetical protein
MQIVIYIFGASFVFMAAVLMMTYKRTRHYGVFLLALTYAASAVLAVVLTHWWPLAAGFVLAWVLRFLGLDPDVRKEDGESSVKE